MNAAIEKLVAAAANLQAAAARHREMLLAERAYETAWELWAQGIPVPDRLRAMI